MSLDIDSTNCIMNLSISAEKSIISETLLVEHNFLKELQIEVMQREENISVWCDASKTKMFVWFSTYDEK